MPNYDITVSDAIIKTEDGRFGGRMFANIVIKNMPQTGGYLELWAANLDQLKALAEGLVERVAREGGVILAKAG